MHEVLKKMLPPGLALEGIGFQILILEAAKELSRARHTLELFAKETPYGGSHGDLWKEICPDLRKDTKDLESLALMVLGPSGWTRSPEGFEVERELLQKAIFNLPAHIEIEEK